MAASVEQYAWVQRVLGVESRRGAGAEARLTLPVWQQAKDAVDAQLNGLYDALKRTGIPGLIEFADQIEATLGKFRVGLITALTQYDQASEAAKDKLRSAALATISNYRTMLASDDRVVAADTNPFGVPVTVRAILGQALDQLQQQLESA